MSTILTLTPSDFIRAVRDGNLSPQDLAHEGDLPTQTMRAYYKCTGESNTETKVLIGSPPTRRIIITNDPGSAPWGAIIDTAINQRASAFTIEWIFNTLLKSGFDNCLNSDSPQSLILQDLFSQAFLLISYAPNGTKLAVQ